MFLPGWPLLMDAALAARFVQATRRDFLAGVGTGVYPPGRILPPNKEPRWHRYELEAVLGRLYGLDSIAPAQQDEAGRQAAMDALKNYDPCAPRKRPASLRHGGQQA